MIPFFIKEDLLNKTLKNNSSHSLVIAVKK